MKLNNKILEAVNRGIKLALDDYEDSEIKDLKVGQIKDLSKTRSIIATQKLVEISKIPIHNTIYIDPEIKKQIRKKYKELVNLCLNNNIKCPVYTREDLKEFLRRIVPIDPKANLNWIDTSNLTNMLCLFDDFMSKLFHGDISEWDVSNVTNMFKMFYYCQNFNCDISNWNVSKVTNMDWMFGECKVFNQPIGKWNVSNVTTMAAMFSGCSKFNLDLSNWNVSNVKDMAYMFSRCKNLDLDFSKWDVSNVEKNSGFYYNTEFSKHPEKCPDFDINKTMGNV